MKPNRIIIIGPSLSGKTYFSKKLSNVINIPAYDLDDIIWKEKYTKRNSYVNVKKMFTKIHSKKKWIIEGIYGSWIEPAVKKSDLVILMYPRNYKFIIRFLERLIKRKNNTFKNIKDNIRLLKLSLTYNKRNTVSSYKKHLKLIKKNKKPLIILRTNKDIINFLKN